MTKTSHTPGPWRITRDQTPGQFVTVDKVRDAHNSVICTLHVNAEANARLIVEAPDLFDLAVQLVKVAEDWPMTQAYRKQLAETARATITKITGD